MVIPVQIFTSTYDIILERGCLKQVSKFLDLNRKVLIVTDSGVPEQYTDLISKASLTPVLYCFLHGEQSKNLTTWMDILHVLAEHHFTRSDCVCAVGGGVCGDMAGFAAACYMRGIDFYNIPTTLLSQLDSSIGGKTAVDFEGAKNLIGSFYPPRKVLIDPDVLGTLDRRQLMAGLAEAIKMAVSYDKLLFEYIKNSDSLERDLTEIIYQSLLIKRDVVQKDPLEKGLRKVLNFGHTIGHAIESKEAGALLHGECVALGMLPMSSPDVQKQLKSVLEKYNLPVTITQKPSVLLPWLVHDKKSQSRTISVVLVDQPGTFRFESMTPEEILARIPDPADKNECN